MFGGWSWRWFRRGQSIVEDGNLLTHGEVRDLVGSAQASPDQPSPDQLSAGQRSLIALASTMAVRPVTCRESSLARKTTMGVPSWSRSPKPEQDFHARGRVLLGMLSRPLLDTTGIGHGADGVHADAGAGPLVDRDPAQPADGREHPRCQLLRRDRRTQAGSSSGNQCDLLKHHPAAPRRHHAESGGAGRRSGGPPEYRRPARSCPIVLVAWITRGGRRRRRCQRSGRAPCAPPGRSSARSCPRPS